jgi:hypothetical protein
MWTPEEWAQAVEEALPWERDEIHARWLETIREGVSILGQRNGLPPLVFGEELPDECFEDPWAM